MWQGVILKSYSIACHFNLLIPCLGSVVATADTITTVSSSIGTPSTSAPCAHAPASVNLTCFKGITTKPTINVEETVATTIEFSHDQSRRCVALAYDMHAWLLERTDRSMLEADRRDRGAYDTVVASCSGRGVVSISHQDPDTVASSRFIVKTENSRACRAFFYELLEFALSFWAMIDQSLFSEDI